MEDFNYKIVKSGKGREKERLGLAGKKKEGKRITVAGKSNTVLETIRRVQVGTLMTRLEGWYYDGHLEKPPPDIQRMSRIEMLELQQETLAKIKDLNEQVVSQQAAAAEAAEAAQQAAEGPPPSEVE